MNAVTTRDRIAGCLIAGGLGDALGYEVEFSSWPAIQGRFGRNGIRELALRNGKARISDDTQMTLFTAEGMVLGYDRVKERHMGSDYEVYIYEAYLCWLQTQGYHADSLWSRSSRLLKNPDMNHPRAPGNTCLSALLSGKMGSLDKPINHSKGCGGVMRTAPCGLVRRDSRGDPFGDPLMLGAKAAAITHGHPMGWVPAGMLSDIVDRCLYENYDTLRELVEASLAQTLETFASCEGINAFEALMRRAIELSARPHAAGLETASVDEPAIRSLGGGWVGDEALAIAVYAALRYDSDLQEALIASVNHGGDSDSTGAICGNILGSWLGINAIDPAWIEKLELVDEMEALTDALTRITNSES